MRRILGKFRIDRSRIFIQPAAPYDASARVGRHSRRGEDTKPIDLLNRQSPFVDFNLHVPANYAARAPQRQLIPAHHRCISAHRMCRATRRAWKAAQKRWNAKHRGRNELHRPANVTHRCCTSAHRRRSASRGRGGARYWRCNAIQRRCFPHFFVQTHSALNTRRKSTPGK